MFIVYMEPYQDSFNTTFSTFPQMYTFHHTQAASSLWTRCRVSSLQVEPLGPNVPLLSDVNAFASGAFPNAVADTADNLGLALRVNGNLHPLRETAYKILLDRAKIGLKIQPWGTIYQKQKECRMIVLEIKHSDLVVRIHDDYCQQATDRQLSVISQILSDAHKRWLSESSEITAIQIAPTAS